MAHGLRRQGAPTLLLEPEGEEDEQAPPAGNALSSPSARAQKAGAKLNHSLERYGSQKQGVSTEEFNNLRISYNNGDGADESSDDDSIGYDSADEADDNYMVPGRFTLKHQSEAFMEVARAEKRSPAPSRGSPSNQLRGGRGSSPQQPRGALPGRGTPPRLPSSSKPREPASRPWQ